MPNIALINLDEQDVEFKKLLDYQYLNLKLNGNDNIFVSKEHTLELMTDFIRLLVKKGDLIPKEGYEIDELTKEKAIETTEFVNSFFK